MFSAQCKYALRATVELVNSTHNDEKLSGVELAEILSVPKPFLLKILQDLVRKGLISSKKGPQGGFYLSEKNLTLTVLEFLERNDCDQTLKSCVLGLEKCSAVNPCAIHHLFAPVVKHMNAKFAHLTIEQLATNPNEKENILDVN